MSTDEKPGEAIYRPHPDVLFAEVDESEGVLLRLPGATYFAVNETGTEIWRALEDGATVRHVARALENRYEVEAAEALRYTRDFVTELLREDLVQVAPNA